MMAPTRIVSGGQTGADRAALDWAMSRGIEMGGWCPADRRSEDGIIPEVYSLKETTDSAYLVRTERNVRDSDATVIFSLSTILCGGTQATIDFAAALGRPCLHLSQGVGESLDKAAEDFRDFLMANSVKCLNVAGPRASEEPGIGSYVTAVLDRAFPA